MNMPIIDAKLKQTRTVHISISEQCQSWQGAEIECRFTYALDIAKIIKFRIRVEIWNENETIAETSAWWA